MSDEFDAPQSRTEAALQNLLGASNELEAPQSRVEAILQNMLGADNVLEPAQSREEALLLQILDQGGGSGGNPNSVQTITGTAANPWGDVDYEELAEAVYNKNATVTIGYELGYTILSPRPMVANRVSAHETVLWASMLNSGADGGWTAAYNSSGGISSMKALVSGSPVDYIAYASATTSTLIIIWHPLEGSLPNASGVSF